MKCVICKTGDCFKGTTNYTNIQNGKLVVVKNVEANICNNCGEAYFESDTVNYIQQKTIEALRINQEVEVFAV